MDIIIRKAKSSDLPALLKITNYAIEHTDALWINTPFTLDQRQRWMEDRRAHGFPVFVAVNENNELLGYASYGPFRAFEGYSQTIENSVYVGHQHQGKGVGRRLLAELIDHAKEAGFHVMIAGITAGNDASVALHKSFGFEQKGLLSQVGFKKGRWLDLLFMTLLLEKDTSTLKSLS
ncbi:GNAT family N-acetyltransferase [Swingsia samuiensis]|uniref:N-acetyltransferase family protein n=1 Tax=Swingsia samuiensis TaxID=1293412 RepID=A0A4Y6UM74_9PROT|nr:GNAT family N-acetyltransferase [Swingsia samuiensis]QDH17880.1 N-acetyltransferase family protein [Swingsia samuiensis]